MKITAGDNNDLIYEHILQNVPFNVLYVTNIHGRFIYKFNSYRSFNMWTSSTETLIYEIQTNMWICTTEFSFTVSCHKIYTFIYKLSSYLTPASIYNPDI